MRQCLLPVLQPHLITCVIRPGLRWRFVSPHDGIRSRIQSCAEIASIGVQTASTKPRVDFALLERPVLQFEGTINSLGFLLGRHVARELIYEPTEQKYGRLEPRSTRTLIGTCRAIHHDRRADVVEVHQRVAGIVVGNGEARES